MGSWVQPTISRVISCTVNGNDIKSYLRVTSIFETICKPYITGTLKIIDNTNLVDSLQLQGGEAVVITFDAPPQSQQYSQTLYLHSVEGEQSSESFKSVAYTFNLIGPEFYNDASNLVATSISNQTATSAIAQIWGQYIGTPLSILSSSSGMIGVQSPYIAHNMKPLTAIEQLRKTVTGGANSGNTLLYRNAQSAVFAVLQDLLNGAGGTGANFLQKTTWGAVFDELLAYNQAATQVMGGLSNFASSAGSLGGSLNNQTTNSSIFPRGSAPDTRTIAERALSASTKDRPQVTVKVPLQTGITVTVGNICNFQLLPVTADLTSPTATINPLSGNYLVAHLSHNVITAYNKVFGTTTMQCLKVG